MAIDFEKTGAPFESPRTVSALINEIKECENPGEEVGDAEFPEIGIETTLGMGPNGNMFGASAPDAARTIQRAYNFGGPDSVPEIMPSFATIEEIRGAEAEAAEAGEAEIVPLTMGVIK